MLVVAVSAVAALVGWHYSNEIFGPDAPLAKTGQSILAVTDSTLTLTLNDKSRRPGQWGFEWPGGHGHAGPLIEVQADRVVTRFSLASGSPPDTTGRLAGFVREATPRTWLGIEYEDVTIPARIGPLPAWMIDGRDSTWAVFVHGRGATRAEVLRMLPGYMALGLPCLLVSYRNDEGAPPSPVRGYRMGLAEWEDLEDAVKEARTRGARDVVLVGCSMGGGIVAMFLRRSPLVEITRAVVLDAPALDWDDILSYTGVKRGLPAFVTDWGKTVAAWRGGLRWSELSQVEHADAFSTPMLIFHGDADETVPIEVSERFAAACPDLVTFVPVPTAGHVEAANLDAAAYKEHVQSWLLEHGIGAADDETAERAQAAH